MIVHDYSSATRKQLIEMKIQTKEFIYLLPLETSVVIFMREQKRLKDIEHFLKLKSKGKK